MSLLMAGGLEPALSRLPPTPGSLKDGTVSYKGAKAPSKDFTENFERTVLQLGMKE